MLTTEIAACMRLLDELAGASVRIIETQSLGSEWAPVERLVLADDYPRLGWSVVVKSRRRDEAGWGTDRAYLNAEQTALTMLAEAELDVAPEALAFDEAAGVLVMRDLGPSPTVEHILFEGRGEEATAALAGLGTSLGRVHAATVGSGSAPWNELAQFERAFDGRWHRLAAEAERLGFPDLQRAVPDVAALATALDDTRWRTLAHGDLTPANALMDDGMVHLVDFEWAGPRHAAIDGAAFRLSFPQYGRWAVLPDDVAAAADRAYRTELAKGLPWAADEDVYGRAMATGCAAWAVVRLSRLGKIADEEQDPEVKRRRRSQIVHTVESSVSVAAGTGAYPALMTWFGSVTEEMRRRWPEANVEPRRFPAFASESSADD